MKTKQHFWMMLWCLLPLLLIFLLPVFQVNNSMLFFIIIVAIFIGHLFMMGHHVGGSHIHGNIEDSDKDKENDREQHKH